MTTPKRNTPPGLHAAGSRLWRSIATEYELDIHEEALLLQAARTLDRLDAMAKELEQAALTVQNHRGDQVPNPLLTESRQQSLTLSRLLASLRLPSGEEAGEHRPQRRGASRPAYGVRAVV